MTSDSKDASDPSLLFQVLSMLFGSSQTSTPSSDQGMQTTISDQGMQTTISDQDIQTTISDQGMQATISDQDMQATISDQGIQSKFKVSANFFIHACPSYHPFNVYHD
jgi:hypothetical protein